MTTNDGRPLRLLTGQALGLFLVLYAVPLAAQPVDVAQLVAQGAVAFEIHGTGQYSYALDCSVWATRRSGWRFQPERFSRRRMHGYRTW